MRMKSRFSHLQKALLMVPLMAGWISIEDSSSVAQSPDPLRTRRSRREWPPPGWTAVPRWRRWKSSRKSDVLQDEGGCVSLCLGLESLGFSYRSFSGFVLLIAHIVTVQVLLMGWPTTSNDDDDACVLLLLRLWTFSLITTISPILMMRLLMKLIIQRGALY